MLHPGELATDVALVRRLLAQQHPLLSGPVERVDSTGTVNAVYRIGEHLCARLPRLPQWAEDLERELRWLPELAPQLPLAVPRPMAEGRVTPDYPCRWAVLTWLDGEPYADAGVDDEHVAAQDLAGFVRALRGVPATADAPPAGRRPLAELDEVTRSAVAAAGGALDERAVLRAWDRALEAPAWDGVPVWVHADLLRPNLLVRDGRLSAVLDFGGVGVGDPAADVIAAWSVLGSRGRPVFREALEVDDGAWARARGYALHQAVQIVPYYASTNPRFVELAQRTVREVLADRTAP